MNIPVGNSKEDIKVRRQVISDFYASWIKTHHAYIHVKFQSINETRGRASITYESTKAVAELTGILENAVVVKMMPAKANDNNQKAFDRMIMMRYKGIRLLVGHQKSRDEYVQYCVMAKK